MNSWKRMAFGLALVAGLCGGAWAQNWGHRDGNHGWSNHSASGSVRDHNIPHTNNRNWSYRNNPNYQYRKGQWGYNRNRTWGNNYPNGNYGYYPNGNYGYYPNGTYYPNQGTWGYYPSGTWGYGPGNYGYGGYGASTNDYQIGYRDGLNAGRYDRSSGRRYRPGQHQSNRHGDQAYRHGWMAGYNAGYGRGW